MRVYVFSIAVLLLSACGYSQVKTPGTAMNDFEQFIAKEKFIADTSLHYTGVQNVTLRATMEAKINMAAKDFKQVASLTTPTEKDYHAAIDKGLARFDSNLLDTEDRERVCYYFEELMDIVGLESSGGRLNKWMYGFNPSK